MRQSFESKAGAHVGRGRRSCRSTARRCIGAGQLPEQADQDPGRFRARRTLGPHRARGRRQDGRNPRRSGRHREQDRRRRHDRGRSRGALRARRLHAAQHAARQRGQRDAVQVDQGFARQGPDRDRAAGGDRQHPGGASFARREEPQGLHRARQVEAGRDSLRHRGPRLGDAPQLRVLQHGGRHQDEAGALQGRRRDREGPAVGRGQGDVLLDRAGAGASCATAA